MSVVSVNSRSFILALFIRDDGERFLLGDNGYDFKDTQLHFSANTIENDEVQKQGADGVMLAGQVRRSSVQSFDGYVGDATTLKETIEEMRRDFIAFFAKGHHFRVIYIDTARNAWQRKGGYLVDAPEVKELYQIHPEYHVGLNFEDVNYYSYDEDKDGNEILSNLINVPVSTEAEGGLVWDEYGAVSEDATVEYDTETATATPAKSIHITDAAEAPLVSFRLDGETSQNGTPTPDAPVPVKVVTGENVVRICGKNLLSDAINTTTTNSGTTSTIQSTTWTIIKSGTGGITAAARTDYFPINLASGDSVTFSSTPVSGSFSSGTTFPQIIVYWYDANKTQLGYTTTASTSQDITAQSYSKTYTASSNVAYFRVGEYIPGATTGTTAEVVLHLQLELGSATAYEPYQGQSYEINLGKNLASISSGNNVVLATLPAGTYTFSMDYDYSVGYSLKVGSGSGATIISRYPDGSGRDAATFTISETTSIFINGYSRTTGETYADGTRNYQLELGSQASSYAAYFEPIELCKIGDYQDYIYKDGSDWKIHKAVGKHTFTGSETWGINTGLVGGYMITYSASASPFYGKLALGSPSYQSLCSNFRIQTNGSTWSGDGWGGFNASGVFWCEYLAKTTRADFLAWIADAGVAIYYPLATEAQTDTTITNAALIAQLEAVLGGRTYSGINNIFTITPNEQGTLEISYYTKYQPVISEGGYIWEAGGSGGATTVINNSIGNVNPVWTIYGPTNNPVLENTTTGEQIEYVGSIADGQTLTIDMGEQTASLDGLNVISNVIGDYISLAPGANTLIYSVSGDAGASELGWSEIVG